MAKENIVTKNLQSFWEKKGEKIIEKYKDRLKAPEGNSLDEEILNERLAECKTLIITANHIEGIIVSKCLTELNRCGKMLDEIAADGHLYQFAEIDEKPVVHIWPQNTSSFTIFGSFNALTAAFKRFTPKRVFSIGVAFGSIPRGQNDNRREAQELGDVIVSEQLIFYDAFNKRKNGSLTLNANEVYCPSDKLLGGWRRFLNTKNHLYDICKKDGKEPFDWHLGSILTGGTVLSDANEKRRLLRAAGAIGRSNVVGGEMEGCGVYFACQGAKREIPFIVVKGICDWGEQKNGWDFATKDGVSCDDIKDCVQAYACENAFFAMRYLLKHTPRERKNPLSPKPNPSVKISPFAS